MTFDEFSNLQIGDYVAIITEQKNKFVYRVINKLHEAYSVKSINGSYVMTMNNYRIWTKLSELDKIKLL